RRNMINAAVRAMRVSQVQHFFSFSIGALHPKHVTISVIIETQSTSHGRMAGSSMIVSHGMIGRELCVQFKWCEFSQFSFNTWNSLRDILESFRSLHTFFLWHKLSQSKIFKQCCGKIFRINNDVAKARVLYSLP